MTSFLQQLASATAAGAATELAALSRLKAADLGRSNGSLLNSSTGTHAGAERIEAWDLEYYSAVAKAKAASQASARAASDYLHLDVVLDGFSALMERLLGISMSEVPLGASERCACLQAAYLRCFSDLKVFLLGMRGAEQITRSDATLTNILTADMLINPPEQRVALLRVSARPSRGHAYALIHAHLSFVTTNRLDLQRLRILRLLLLCHFGM